MTKKRKFLIIGSSVALPAIIAGTIIGAVPTYSVLSKKITKLKEENAKLLAEIKRLRDQNKTDQYTTTTLRAQNERLEILVKQFNETTLNKSDFNNVLTSLSKEISSGKSVGEIVKNVGYKQLESPLIEYKNSLQEKITSLSSTLDEQLQNNDLLTEDTKKLIKASIAKGQNLLSSLNENSFSDIETAKASLEKIVKSQNIYLAQVQTALDIMKTQLDQNNTKIAHNVENIKTRNDQILKLVKQSNDTLSFYLQKIEELSKNLTTFKDSNFDNVFTPSSANTIKGLITQALEIFNNKKVVFEEIVNTSKQKMSDLNLEEDFETPIISYDLPKLSQSFDEVLKKYEDIRTQILNAYNEHSNKLSGEVLKANELVNALKAKQQDNEDQITLLTKDKATLEANIAEIKKDLTTNLGSMLDSQITSLNGIENTIRSSNIPQAISLANQLKVQIDALQGLKSKYTAENYTQTFAPVVKQALDSAQQVIDEYKRNVLDALKTEFESTKATLAQTQGELEKTKSELTLKQNSLSEVERSLAEVNQSLAQNKQELDRATESLTTTNNQLQTLKQELKDNQLKVENTFTAVNSAYTNLKAKANTLIGEMDSSINVSELKKLIDENVPIFNPKDSSAQQLASIQNLIDKSTQLSNLFNKAAQDDFKFKQSQTNQKIRELNKEKETIQNGISDLQEKQARFKSVLSKNIITLNSAYSSRKTAAQTIVATAKSLSLPTEELEKLLSLQDLQAPGNDLTKQIDFVEQYTTRISKLGEETLKLQNAILNKTTSQTAQAKKELEDIKKQKEKLEETNRLLAKKDAQNQAQIAQLQKTIQAKEKELQNAISQRDQALKDKATSQKLKELQHQQDQDRIKNLNNEIDRLKEILFKWQLNPPNQDSNSESLERINTLEFQNQRLNKEKQELQNELNDANNKLREAIETYKKYNNALTKSNVYKNATETSNYKNDSGRTNALTGYGDYYDKYRFGGWFSTLYPGKTPDSVSIIQLFNLRLRNTSQGPHTFRIWYLDTTETDPSKQLKSTIETWNYNMSDGWAQGYGEIYHNPTAKTSNAHYIHSEYLVINKINDWAPNKVMFYYVMASWDKNKNQIWDLTAKQVIVSIEELDNN